MSDKPLPAAKVKELELYLKYAIKREFKMAKQSRDDIGIYSQHFGQLHAFEQVSLKLQSLINEAQNEIS